MSEFFIVGEDCSINEVVVGLSSPDITPILRQNIFDIAIHLNTNLETIDKIKVDLDLRKIKTSEAILRILQEWVASKGNEATLGQLYGVLEATELKGGADILRKKFGSLQSSDRQYCRVPKDLEDFLADTSLSKQVLILQSFDISITSNKVSQVTGQHIHTFHDYIRLISLLRRNEKPFFVTATCFKELEEILSLETFTKVIVISNYWNERESEMLSEKPFKSTIRLGFDEMDWNDLTSVFKFSIRSSLENKFGVEIPTGEQADVLSGNILVQLISGSELKYFQSTFPKPINYYINRTLLTRDVISKNVFQEMDGIFVVSGIARHELSRLVEQQRTELSSNLLGHEPLGVRWIVLEEQHHFYKICGKALSEKVHWLQKEKDGRFRWVQSTGNIKLMQKYIDPSQDSLEEEVFYQSLLNGQNFKRPILVCDSPGMGKSVLLANIGVKLLSMYPKRLILFLSMPNYINEVKKLEALDRPNAVEISLERLTCTSQLEKLILKNKIHSAKLNIEILLDDFDEVDAERFKLATQILLILNTYQSSRLWVTSRPHRQHELEQILNVLSYNIIPFSRQDQVSLLTAFWLQNRNLLGTEKEKERLSLFAENCLENLEAKLNSRDQAIAGIPLQCFMIGEIFEEDAINVAKSEGLCFPANQFSSISKLYDQLIDVKIEKYNSTYGKIKSSKEDLIDMHIYLSVKLFFPDQLDYLDLRMEPDAEQLLSIGIVESSCTSNSPVFIHRTFAEYFMALYTTELMITNELKKGKEMIITQFIFKWVLTGLKERVKIDPIPLTAYAYLFDHSVIIYFINSILGDSQNRIPGSFQVYIPRLHHYLYILIRMTNTCVSANLFYLFKFFDEIITIQEPIIDITQKRVIFTKEVVYLAGLRADLNIFIDVIERCQELCGELDPNLLPNMLRIAAARGDFSIAEFLINVKGLRHYIENLNETNNSISILHDCVSDSEDNSASQIKQKIEIINFLVQLNPCLLEVRGDLSKIKFLYGTQIGTPILSFHVHFQLILELIRLGANVLATSDWNETILNSNSVKHLNPEEYHLLVASIPQDVLKILVNRESRYAFKRTPLADIIEFIDLTSETLEIFKGAGADFNSLDESGDSVLGNGVTCGRKTTTIRNLIKFGANVNHVNSAGESILMKALYDIDVVDLLIEAGANVNYIWKSSVHWPFRFTQDANSDSEDDGVSYDEFVNAPKEYSYVKDRLTARRAHANYLARRASGLPALGYALVKKDVDIIIIEKLVMSGTNLEFVTKNGYSFLTLAIMYGNDEKVIRVLIDGGCDIKWRSRWKRNSLLHYAAKHGNMEAIKLLVEEKGFNVNGKNLSLKTPLYYAKKFGRDNICIVLEALGGLL